MALFQINNFTGNLTRKALGTMNSGLARIGKSHSIDPFTNPPALLFNEAATNLDPTHATITDIIVDGVVNEESGTLYLYSIDRSGSVYKINTSTDAITLITNSLAITLKYGGGIKTMIANGTPYLFIAHDTGALYMKMDGSGRTDVNITTSIAVTDAQVILGNSTLVVSSSVTATLLTGQLITASGGSVPPPSPLVYGTQYYVIPFDSTHIRLAATAADAFAGNYIVFTDTGAVGGTFDFSLYGWILNIPHPISDEFFGSFQIGNSAFLVDFAIGALTVSNVSRLNPTFPLNYQINAITVDGEGRYLRVNATTGTTQDIITTNPTAPAQAPISRTVYWNGIDDTYDSYDPSMQTNLSSMFSFLGLDISYGQDFWGAAMFQTTGGSVDKKLAMKEVKPPTSNSITSSGNLLFFAAAYFVQNVWRCGIFGYGTLDDQDQPSFYQLLGLALSDGNTICTAVGMLRLVQNRYLKSDGTYLTDSKFYVSTYETGATPKANLYSFNLTPGASTPNGGVYETQIEEFTMMQQVDRLAFYIQPPSAGVSFKLELVDVDSTVPSGASFTYTYAAGSDETLLQGVLEFFEWANLQVKNFQAMGLRITNLGTVQPGLMQIYIETHDVDKGASQLQQQSTTP